MIGKNKLSANSFDDVTWAKYLAWLLAIATMGIMTLKCAIPLDSVDLWWHMALGRHMLETGQLIVDHSIFTWTPATTYHIYNAWLSEITLYLIYENIGAIGLIGFGFLVHSIFLIIAVFFALQRGIVFNPLTWLVIILGVVLSFFVTMVQPESFSFLFMTLTVWLYFYTRAIGSAAWRLYYLFPVILILWVNSHGAFAVAALFFVAIIVGEMLNIQFSSPYSQSPKLWTHLFIVLSLCILALFINPFGYHLPLHLLKSAITAPVDIAKLKGRIGGWDNVLQYSSSPYYAVDYLIIAMVVYAFLLWQKIKNRQLDWVVILVVPIYSIIFFKISRSSHFLAPVFVFASLDLLAYQENSAAWPITNYAKSIVAITCFILIGLIGWRTVYSAVCANISNTLLNYQPIDSKIPVEEAAFIKTMPGVKKIGNTYDVGGYLLYALWPDKLTFIDSRYFPFTDWSDELLGFQGGYGIQNFLDKYHADIWLINYRHSILIHWFQNSKDWSPLFVGPAGVIFGPATHPKKPPEISANIGHTDHKYFLLHEFQYAIALQNHHLIKNIQEYAESIAAHRFFCAEYSMLAQDMRNAAIGLDAFNRGDYATAAVALRKNSKDRFIDSTNTTIWALTFLAKRAWDANDYANARAHAMEALSLSPKNVASVYNAAITDWQYRINSQTTPSKVSDDITWQFLASVLLRHQEKIPQTQNFIVGILVAMINGTLNVKPPFITPFTIKPKS